MKLILTI